MIIDSAAIRWYNNALRSIRLRYDHRRRTRKDFAFSSTGVNKQALKSILFARRKKMGRAARGKLKPPTRWLYPWATERRYGAAIRAWLRPLKNYVHEYLKNNQEAILRGDSATLVRQDATPGGSYRRMVKSLNGWASMYLPPLNDSGTRDDPPQVLMGLRSIAETMNDFNNAQWEKTAKAELGVEFPVYESWWPDTKQSWEENNYELIRSLSSNYINQVNIQAERAVTSGASPSQLAKEIAKIDQTISTSRANLIARDQIGKLNGQVTQARMESAGLEMYIWSTSLDERVRGSHAELEGKLCRWDDSTVYSEDGGKTWKDRPADWCQLHPGQDIQCRCTALAYFDELIGEVDRDVDSEEGVLNGAFGDGPGKVPPPPEGKNTPGPTPQNKIPWDDAPEGIKTKLKEILDEGLKSGKEHMKLMTSDGTVLASQMGDKGQVKISGKTMDLIDSLPENTVSLAHNHPTGESFSGEDLAMLRHKSIKEVRVVGNNGITYNMTVGDGERPKPEIVKSAHSKELAKHVWEYFDKVNSGGMTAERAAYLSVSDTNYQMAKDFGWTYKEGKIDG